MSKTKKSISTIRSGEIKRAAFKLCHCTKIRVLFNCGTVYLTGVNSLHVHTKVKIGTYTYYRAERDEWVDKVLSVYMQLSKELTVSHVGSNTLRVAQFTGRRVATIIKVGQRWVVTDKRYIVCYKAASYPAAIKFVKGNLC